jgi:hypothetical protein
MRWLKRGLWLAAWGVWAWCGFGLYRELPRKLGTPLTVNPWKAKTWQDVTFVGFIGDTNRFVVIHKTTTSGGSDWGSPTQVGVYDAESGSLLLKVPGPRNSDLLWNDFYSPGHASIFAKVGPDDSEPGAHRLDLESGKWHRVSQRSVASGGVHRTRPLVLLAEQGNDLRNVDRVVVVNWRTGRKVFARKLPSGARLEGQRAFFSGDGERVVIPLMEAGGLFGMGSEKSRVEVWRLAEPPELEKTIVDAPIGLFPSFASGRVAFSHPYGTPTVDVYDLDDGRYVFSNMPRDQRPTEPVRSPGDWRPPVLSPSGKRVFGGAPMTLWDADSGKVVWQAHAGEMAFAEGRGRGRARDCIGVLEHWHGYWKNWFPNFQYRTHAVYDLETGRLMHRVAPTDVIIQPSFWNAAGTLAVSNHQEVYRLPLPVNWSLLSLCQSILALPLLLLWLALLWRRKRRERRLAGATV